MCGRDFLYQTCDEPASHPPIPPKHLGPKKRSGGR
ncbi:hypothetical protein LINGRAHAP2_LOCUS9670 [Linum grandiflorum]